MESGQANNVVRVDKLDDCARCGKTHALITFLPLKNAPPDTTHYAMCPDTNQPIL